MRTLSSVAHFEGTGGRGRVGGGPVHGGKLAAGIVLMVFRRSVNGEFELDRVVCLRNVVA